MYVDLHGGGGYRGGIAFARMDGRWDSQRISEWMSAGGSMSHKDESRLDWIRREDKRSISVQHSSTLHCEALGPSRSSTASTREEHNDARLQLFKRRVE